jgi:hypothetical protein
MSGSFNNYMSASRRLRGAITQSRSDADFVSKGGQIVYLFDTNIVESYLRANHAIVGAPFRAGEIFTPQAAEVSGRLTLKYLFSGELPGQRGPAFLSTPHWNEALGRADRVATSAREGLKQVDRDSIAKLAQAYPVLHALKDSPFELLKTAESMGVASAFLALAKTASADLRLQDAFAGRGQDRRDAPYVMDINHCEAFWPAAINAVRRDDFRSWQAKLNAERKRLSTSSSHTRDAQLTNNIEHDAMTLAAIQALYRENPEAGGDFPSVRFVLVSADRAMEATLQTGASELEKEGIPNFLRHPRVYMPLLNFSSMNKSILANAPEYAAVRDVFDEVERAIKALFPFDYDDRSAQRWSSHWDVGFNIDRWSSAADPMILVNSRYVLNDIDDVDAAISQVTQMLQQSDVLAAAAEGMSSTLRAIRGTHTEQVAGLALDWLATTHRQRAGKGQGEAPRAPLKPLDVDLLKSIRSILPAGRSALATLDDLLERVRSADGKSGSLLQELVERLTASLKNPGEKAAGRLLASAIYFALESWDSAKLCAELCSKSLHRNDRWGPWAREANYFIALAQRMTLRSADEVNSAKGLLSENIKQGEVTSLAYSRDLIELATLMMTAAVVQAIENATPNQALGPDGELLHLIEASRIPRDFDTAVRDLRRGVERVEGFEASQEYAASRVRMQANINLLGGAIFGFLLKDRLTEDPVSRDQIAGAVKTVHQDLADFKVKPVPFTAELYLAIGDYLASPSRVTAEEADRALRRIDRSTLTLSNADAVEQAYLDQQLKIAILSSEPSVA